MNLFKKLSLIVCLGSLINLSAVSLDIMTELNKLQPNLFTVMRTLLNGEQFDETTISIHNCWDYQIMLSELQAARPELTNQQLSELLQTSADLHDTAVLILSGGISLSNLDEVTIKEKCCWLLVSALMPRFIMAPTDETQLQISLSTLHSFDALLLDFLKDPIVGLSKRYPKVHELLKVIFNVPDNLVSQS